MRWIKCDMNDVVYCGKKEMLYMQNECGIFNKTQNTMYIYWEHT